MTICNFSLTLREDTAVQDLVGLHEDQPLHSTSLFYSSGFKLETLKQAGNTGLPSSKSMKGIEGSKI